MGVEPTENAYIYRETNVFQECVSKYYQLPFLFCVLISSVHKRHRHKGLSEVSL